MMIPIRSTGRSSVDPVHPIDNGYFLTRYQDCPAVYRDRRFSSDKKEEFRPKFGDSPLYEHHTTSLVFNDLPLHTRVRKIIMGALDAAPPGGWKTICTVWWIGWSTGCGRLAASIWCRISRLKSRSRS